MTAVSGDEKHIIFDRISETQSIRCSFDFETLTASFEEI
jgi:alpha-glucosidase